MMDASLNHLLPSEPAMVTLCAVALKATFVLATAACAAALLRRGSAGARHRVWALGVASALLVPVLSLGLPTLPLPAVTGAADGAETSASPPPSASLTSASGWTAASASPVRSPALPPGLPWLSWLALPWAAGTMLVSARVIRGHRAARRLRLRADPRVHAAWTEAALAAAAILGLRGSVPVLRSAEAGVPLTLGLLRPAVLLPAAADAWDPERLRTVLLHELGHVARQDNRVQLAAQLLTALYWWNPLAWRAAAALRVEREHAADDLVLQVGVPASRYAAELLAVARSLTGHPLVRAGAVCMVEPGSTEARILRVLAVGLPREPWSARSRGFAACVALSLTTAVACVSAADSGPGDSAAPRGRVSLAGEGVDVRVGPRNELRPPLALTTSLEGQQADPKQLTAELRRQLPALERCYAGRLTEQPALSGEVGLHFSVDADGKLVESCLAEEVIDDEVIVKCVNDAMAAATFPSGLDPDENYYVTFVFDRQP